MEPSIFRKYNREVTRGIPHVYSIIRIISLVLEKDARSESGEAILIEVLRSKLVS